MSAHYDASGNLKVVGSGVGGLADFKAMEVDLDAIRVAAEDTTPVGVKVATEITDWITWTVDTSALAVGDVMVTAALELTTFFSTVTEVRKIVGLVVHDTSDQGVGFDLYLENAATSLGTQNAAPTLTAAAAEAIIGMIPVDAADYYDLINSRKAQTGMERAVYVKANGSSTSLWISGVTRGAPTYASAIKLKFITEKCG